MNPGTRGLCGADEQVQSKKKKKKNGVPSDQPSNNPNYKYVKCRYDPAVRHPLSLPP
jgi:hypothetical protein